MSCYFIVCTYIDKDRALYDEYIRNVKPIVERAIIVEGTDEELITGS
jgi:hypothetical protein